MDKPQNPRRRQIDRAHTEDERTQMMERLRLFQHVADTNPDALYVFDFDSGRTTYVNAQSEQVYGYTPDDVAVLGERFATTHWHPDDLASLPEHRRKLRDLADGEIYETEYRVRQPDGTYRWLSTRSSVFSRGEDGHVRQIVGVTQNITNHKQVEEMLRESEARFRGCFDLGLTGMAITSRSAEIIEVNDQICAILGYERSELVKMTWVEITHPDDLAADIAQVNRILAGEIDGYTLDKRWIGKDGQVIDSTISVKCLRRPDGEMDYFVAALQGTTERLRVIAALQDVYNNLETQVVQRTRELTQANTALQEENAERHLAERRQRQIFQQLVSTQEDERQRIARELHDSLGQDLSALHLVHQSLLVRDDSPPDILEGLQKARELALRIDDVVDRLAFELRPPSLDDLGLEAALCLLIKEWMASTGIPADVVTHGLDHDQLLAAVETVVYRVVQEALTNVLKHAQATRVSLIVERRVGELLAIIEDNGSGFDLERATAEARKLGITGMRERAELAGGRLAVETAPGAGTTIYMHLPLAPGKEDQD